VCLLPAIWALSVPVGGEARIPDAEALDALCGRVRAAALIDAAGGEPLYLHHAEDQLPPASTVKLMLLLVAAEAIESGAHAPTDSLTASRRAWNTGGQQIYVAEGDVFTVEDMALATAVHSANDAAVVLAEGLFGSYAGAVSAMNARAADLDLSTTVFHSPHGLPESWGHHGDRSCALDLALLGRAAAANPLVAAWCATPRAVVGGRELIMVNSNELLGKVEGIEGLKTGFTQVARYCFIGSAERDGRRLICAILGADSSRHRFRLAEALFDYGFARTERRTVVEAGAPVGIRPVARRWRGPDQVAVVAADSLTIAVEPLRVGSPAFHLMAPDTLGGPAEDGDIVGELVVFVGNTIVGRVPARVDRSIELGRARRLAETLAGR
jgi:D-alanyl-D-alanine carboxypeptidase (penicillin-binding protein 5/6)